MREIIFRVWDKEWKQMIYDDSDIQIGMDGTIYEKKQFTHGMSVFDEFTETDQYEIMQYTGLKDKDGTKIYEGDILKNVLYNQLLKVTWVDCDVRQNKQGGRFTFRKPGFDFEAIDGWTKIFVPHENCEVVGNLYENPELLK